MQPLFSIVIPTLNEEKFIPKLLTDLKKQTERDFEVIVVDAKSHDQTKQQVSKFKTDLKLHFFEAKKRNVSHQRNHGALKAKGKYLVFLDADSRVGQNFLEKLKTFISTKAGLVLLPYVDPAENRADVKTLYQFINFLIDVSQNTKKPLSSVGGMIWEKNFFKTIGGFDEEIFIGEDHSIVQKAARWGVKAQFMPHIKIKFSFRRIKKEGSLKSLYKLLKGTFHTFFKGDIKEEIFDYEMGGHLYGRGRKKLKRKELEQGLDQVKQFFKQFP